MAIYISSIIYPLYIIYLLLINKENTIINLYKDLSLNFNYDNKLLALAFIMVTLATNLYAISTKRKLEVVIGSIYSFFSLIALFAGDFISLFMSLEIMMIMATILIFYGNHHNSAIGARQYFLTHLISGSLILIGISYIIANNPNIQLIPLTDLIENNNSNVIFYILILAGCLINVAVPPFSGWMVNCYPASSTTGLIYLISFTSKISIIIILKLFSGLEILKFFGILMIIYSGIYACLEDNIKRVICYLTILSLGFMLIAIGTKGTEMTAEITMFLFVHIVYNALFSLYFAVLIDKYRTEYFSEIKMGGGTNFLHKSKKPSEFLGETKPGRVAYSSSSEESMQASTTKLSTRLAYVGSLIKNPLLLSSLTLSILLMISFPYLSSFSSKNFIIGALNKDISYYAVVFSKIIICVAIFSMVKLKNIVSNSLASDLLSKISLLIMLLFTLIISCWLEEFCNLCNLPYPLPTTAVHWSDITEQLAIILSGILGAVAVRYACRRHSTANFNIDVFRFIENIIGNIYFKYHHQHVQHEQPHPIGDNYAIFQRTEKTVLHKIKSLHNQSTSLFIVMSLLISFTIYMNFG